MSSKQESLRNRIESTVIYLRKYLKLASCHMVDFLSENLWEELMPSELKTEIDDRFEDTLNCYWSILSGINCEETMFPNLKNFMYSSKSFYLDPNGCNCLSEAQMNAELLSMGVNDEYEVKLDEFMSHKKSYEIMRLTPLVLRLMAATKSHHCLELGGGKGYLLSSLSLSGSVRACAVDADKTALLGGVTMNEKLLKRSKYRTSNSLTSRRHEYISDATDLSLIAKEEFKLTDDDKVRITLAGFNLNKNARMLAVQSIDRFKVEKKLPNEALYYRALLQLILKDKKILDPSLYNSKLKGIAAKSNNFHEYYKAAVKKLNIPDSAQLSDNQLTEYLSNNSKNRDRMTLFYMLRLCLAQVLESIIVLDSVMFLYEKGFDKSFVVKIFDPVMSPRCHAVIAIR